MVRRWSGRPSPDWFVRRPPLLEGPDGPGPANRETLSEVRSHVSEQPLTFVDPRDEIFNVEEAATFVRMSPTTLEASDAPVASMAREEGKRGRKLYLRSQLLLWVLTRTANRIHPQPVQPRLRQVR